MKAFNLNISEIDFRIMVSMSDLLSLGWSFDDLIEYEISNRDALIQQAVEHNMEVPTELSWLDAEKMAGQRRDVEIHITGTVEDYHTTCCIHDANDWSKFGDREDTGDDESTLKDVMFLIENNRYYKISDWSVDSNNCYCSTFEGMGTMK